MDIDVSALKALVREKDLSLDLVVETIEQALLVAYLRTEGASQKDPRPESRVPLHDTTVRGQRVPYPPGGVRGPLLKG